MCLPRPCKMHQNLVQLGASHFRHICYVCYKLFTAQPKRAIAKGETVWFKMQQNATKLGQNVGI